MRKTILLIFMLCGIVAQAQTLQQMGGVYYAYHFDENWQELKAPKGYKPFYISHYGRHGSRWMPSDERYIWVNSQFEDETNLTPLGKKVKQLLAEVWANAQGNGGKLTRLGERQHRGIAHRMVENFPGVFTDGTRVKARSSVVDRCAKSMLAFVAEMWAMQPSLDVDVRTDSADMAWIAYTSPETKALENRTKVVPHISADRFISQLFIDPAGVKDPRKLMSEMHTIASSIQDVALNFKRNPKKLEKQLYSLFTEREFWSIYNANNRRMTICNGQYILNEGIPARSAISLWQNIEAEADVALAQGNPSATLRFGHDTSLYRLLSLFGMDYDKAYYNHELDYFEDFGDEAPDQMDLLLPMAANLQIIFYTNAADDVIVKFLLNERHGLVKPFSQKLKEVYPGFYRWQDVKDYMQHRLHELEHLRQLNSINTMVGTAQANTQTAGMFGKGSEEHGQTLPAVLVPNGQNFWTPQTQDTEQKCIAPYYYKDTHLQGFRNSHWIVGGCTQDYGSFTLATLGGKLRLSPAERATPFSHEDEVSHPHYYSVNLKQEHLKTEMTADSHTAVFRVTPDRDQLVHIVLNHNSDEGQGWVRIDKENHRICGYNPVHRIYQGWGEAAGFGGYFVLNYYNDIVDSGVKDNCAWITLQGKANVPLVFVGASSFTSLENAQKNLDIENGLGEPDNTFYVFGFTLENAQRVWVDRLHTIDVESRDTKKVDQFYGALYRASFLPHEMSDCSGDYPKFGGGGILNAKNTTYGDFSMWDIYRAQLPLYNIIVPTKSGNMMQSLVNMYKEGGWMPVFPCWNSYTAAMIGDHCGVALADAYVKGIRNFDFQTAYEGMRKNAFEQPATFEEYKNGMGRRALESYLKYNYIPMEDSVKEAFHTNEQTSRTLEYAFNDFAVAQLAKALGKQADYDSLMVRSENWRNVINPVTGWADGRHEDGSWEENTDLVHRKSYITEGATCHYTWYVPHNPEGLFGVIGKDSVVARLDKMFDKGLYWHGNEPCHQIAYLYDAAGAPRKAQQRIHHILNTEYNDTPGGLSGNDDAGQMSAWYLFSAIGFYPVCPSTPYYYIGTPSFDKVTFNMENGKQFSITAKGLSKDSFYIRQATLNGKPFSGYRLSHEDLVKGGTLHFELCK